ncbi:hypothetical protein IW492_00495 [Enterococcus sp. BWB1-3]|uniref:hypothetical protein n=1 Tax=unclassified Enterococcus TaxID=2608891 RepID=UPI0019232DC9|nr:MULTISPECIES: hypothetical protein [unclassified Enterococcus]MBL1227708.1 hypothetical protein [Enterococcus sp. BWB1-3]MCB5954488.1 hypothetical protein [Enterococcus sp. CWB-B31]
MNLAFLAVMYFFVVIIIILGFLLFKEKQLMYKLLDEKDQLQEDLSEMKVERVRMNHMLKMQDESIVHLMDEPELQEGTYLDEPEEELSERTEIEQRVVSDELEEELNEEPFIILNNGTFSRYEDEYYQNREQ